jgi:nucleoside-triphosphatase
MKWDFTMTQHIFLTGKKHIGKSTLIQKILDELHEKYNYLKEAVKRLREALDDYKKTADGFLTVRTKDYLKNQYSVHMYHLKEKEFPNESNLLFLCGKTDEHTADTFDRLGCNILSMCSDCSLIVMDELGPHEADAALFRKKILNLLDGQTPILGVLQEPAESFWPEIVNHPKVEIITISEDNRNDRALLNYIQCKISSH